MEDVWIDVASDNMAHAKEWINAVPSQNPFNIKYETKVPVTEDWDKCAEVLDKQDKMDALMRGW